MYESRVYKNLVVAIFTDTIAVEDLQQFSKEIGDYATNMDQIFLIALPINVTSYVKNVKEMRDAVSSIRDVSEQVTRLYGIQVHPMLSFVSKVVSNVLKTGENMVEAKSIDDLFQVVEKESVLFPPLKESLSHKLEIQAWIAELQGTTSVKVSN